MIICVGMESRAGAALARSAAGRVRRALPVNREGATTRCGYPAAQNAQWCLEAKSVSSANKAISSQKLIMVAKSFVHFARLKVG